MNTLTQHYRLYRWHALERTRFLRKIIRQGRPWEFTKEMLRLARLEMVKVRKQFYREIKQWR